MSELLKFSVAQPDLKKVLAVVKPFVGRNSVLPVLQSFLVRGESHSGMVTVLATNLESVVAIQVAAQVEQGGAVCLPFDVTNELVGRLSSEARINIAVDAGWLVDVESDGIRQEANLKAIAPDEFPMTPTFPQDAPTTFIPGSWVARAAAEVLPFVATEMTRIMLCGACWKFEAGRVVVAATDGFRLTELQIPVMSAVERTVILPAMPVTAVAKLLKLVGDESADVEVVFVDKQDQHQVFWRVGAHYVGTLSIQGTYPDYKPVIPQSANTIAQVERKSALNRTDVADVIASKREDAAVHAVFVDIKGGDEASLHIQSDAAVGDAQGNFSATVTGPDVRFAVNGRYLAQILKAYTSDQVHVKVSSPAEPILVVPVGDDAVMHLIMPVYLGK